MCEFCEKFDFGNASINVDKYGASIMLAGGSYRYPLHQQFNFCPNCGASQAEISMHRYNKTKGEDANDN